MKKILFGASALALMVGSASAAENLKLGLGGYYNVYGVYVSQDDSAGEPGANTHNFDIKRDAEVYVEGSTRLDNGLEVGALINLATVNAISKNAVIDIVDDSYLYFQGNFGKVTIGEAYSAAYLVQVGTPAVDEEIDGQNPSFQMYNTASNDAPNFYGHSLEKMAKISYISPTMNGFQVGLAFTPDTDFLSYNGMRDDNSPGLITDYQIIDLGLKYSGKIGETAFQIGAGYGSSDAEKGTANPSGYNFGARAQFGKLDVGASYLFVDRDLGHRDGYAYQMGASYDMGAYELAATYYHGEREVNLIIGNDKNTRITLGGTYQYGPGMAFKGAIQHFDLDSTTLTDRNDGYAVILGTNVSF